MHAAVYRRHGAPEVIQRVDVGPPVLGAGRARVGVEAAVAAPDIASRGCSGRSREQEAVR
jgi:NADPH:quinone reductase-like Zn-dependent oxidoreductase